MKDWIKIREILKSIQSQKNKNKYMYLIGCIDLNEYDVSWLIHEEYIVIDEDISYLDGKDVVFVKDLTFKGKKLLCQLSI